MPEYVAGSVPAFVAPTPDALDRMTDDEIRTTLTSVVAIMVAANASK
jgi:hypothetical protein